MSFRVLKLFFVLAPDDDDGISYAATDCDRLCELAGFRCPSLPKPRRLQKPGHPLGKSL